MNNSTEPDISTLSTEPEISKQQLDEMYKLAMTKFASTFVKEDASPKTKPSIVAIGGTKEIDLVRLPPEEIEKFLWMHPAVPRGIEIKANRMTRRGYSIKPYSESDTSKQAVEEMKTLLNNSGGVTRIKKWIEDAFAYGNGFLTLVPNKNEDKIVRINPEHPIFFRIARYKRDQVKEAAIKHQTSTQSKDIQFEYDGPLKVDEATKQPAYFSQWIFSADKKKFIPIGEELSANQVAHLLFDTWGDEVEGISLVQYLHLTIKYLLNTEEAAAETLYKSGFTQKKITTEVMTEKDLKKMAKNLLKINSKDAVILPKGSDVTNLYPGTSQFPEFHEVFLKLICIRLGLPKPILTMDGTSTNKATLDEQVKDMAADFRADEIRVEQIVEEQIFKPACQLLYGEDFEEIPIFIFNPVKEEKEDKLRNLNVLSQTILRLANASTKLKDGGYEEAAQKVADFLEEECFLGDEEI